MNKFIGTLAVIFLLFQFSFFPFIGYEINLLLILVIILSQRRFDSSGIFWIFFCGILADLFSAQMFGVNILSFILVAILINLANSFFVAFESHRLINSVVYFAGKIVFDIIWVFIGRISVVFGLTNFNITNGQEFFSLSYFISLVVFSVAGFCLLLFYEKLEKMSGEKRQGLIINKN